MSKATRQQRAVAQGVMSPEDQQSHFLEEAKKKVTRESFFMKRCLDSEKLMDGLKHASNMIGQLRTSLLTPQNYYELYIQIFDQLKHLEGYLLDEKEKGEKMSKLYELVQYAGNIVPRLYLLVTVGSAYIRSQEAPAKDVLHDLVEMTKGVQHPLRGLFLRNFLSEMVKDKLPDMGNKYEGRGGDVQDAIHFILVNFTEMNKMWVRMQPPKSALKLRKQREAERMELRLLVGKNLAHLGQLEGVTEGIYVSQVLPAILEQIVSCRDRIAQQYLMECVVQIFPDEYHLRTLHPLLYTCSQLVDSVDVKPIVLSLFSRLVNFTVNSPGMVPQDIDVFATLSQGLSEMVSERKESMKLADLLELHVALLEFSIKAYPEKIQNVDQILGVCLETLQSLEEPCTDRREVRQISRLLMLPLETYKDVIRVLNIESYSPIMKHLNFPTRKMIAIDVAKNAIEGGAAITEPEDVQRFFQFIAPLVFDDPELVPEEELDMDDFEMEQNLVASLVHLFHSDNSEKLLEIYATARKIFTDGDPKRTRVRYTFVPLVFGCMALANRMKEESTQQEAQDPTDWAKKGRKLFRFIHVTVTVLVSAVPDLALKLFLQAAQAASRCGFETIAYEFLTQAFVLYEGEIFESKEQVNTMNLIIGTLQTLRCFEAENYDTLITKSALHSSKLLVKSDQCSSVLHCSHLFWTGEQESAYKDGKRVLECLQKCLKIADQVTDPSANVALFIDILNEYLYYFSHGNSHITVKYLNSLIALINTNIGALKPDTTSSLDAYYQATIRYIENKQSKYPAWREIEISRNEEE